MSDLVIVYGGPLIATTHNKCLYYYTIMTSQKVGHSSITPTLKLVILMSVQMRTLFGYIGVIALVSPGRVVILVPL